MNRSERKCMRDTPSNQVLMGILTLKNEGENLKKIQAFDEVQGAQVQIHNYQKIWNLSCPKKYSMEKGNGSLK